jgi:hypothetical protein
MQGMLSLYASQHSLIASAKMLALSQVTPHIMQSRSSLISSSAILPTNDKIVLDKDSVLESVLSSAIVFIGILNFRFVDLLIDVGWAPPRVD